LYKRKKDFPKNSRKTKITGLTMIDEKKKSLWEKGTQSKGSVLRSIEKVSIYTARYRGEGKTKKKGDQLQR